MRWDDGRQLGGYKKKLLAELTWPINIDCYILKFPIGSYVPLHKDKSLAGNHYRLNILLNSCLDNTLVQGKPIYSSNRIKLFRPDLLFHAFSKVTDNTLYILSIGWVIKCPK